MPWQIDTSHSHVNFSARHMMISKARGTFERFEGTIEADENNPAGATVDVRIEAASINTRDTNRDNHLRSPDFLNAEQFPYLTFKSTRVELADEQSGKLYGEVLVGDEITIDIELELVKVVPAAEEASDAPVAA
jgi:polyisoprenoid-binding protein YceI